jgi:hypothetical protein
MSLIVDRQPSSQLVGISKGPLVAALFGHAAIFKLSRPSGVKRKLDLDPARGRFWRKVVGAPKAGQVDVLFEAGPTRGRLAKAVLVRPVGHISRSPPQR